MLISKCWNADIDKWNNENNEVLRIPNKDEAKGNYLVSFILRSSCAEELLIHVLEYYVFKVVVCK